MIFLCRGWVSLEVLWLDLRGAPPFPVSRREQESKRGACAPRSPSDGAGRCRCPSRGVRPRGSRSRGAPPEGREGSRSRGRAASLAAGASIGGARAKRDTKRSKPDLSIFLYIYFFSSECPQICPASTTNAAEKVAEKCVFVGVKSVPRPFPGATAAGLGRCHHPEGPLVRWGAQGRAGPWFRAANRCPKCWGGGHIRLLGVSSPGDTPGEAGSPAGWQPRSRLVSAGHRLEGGSGAS